MGLADLNKKQQEWDERANQAQAKAAHAYARLLDIAQRDTGQAGIARRFIFASFDGGRSTMNLYELRALDVEISDDILACMDALRWARADLYMLVPHGLQRVQALMQEWGPG